MLPRYARSMDRRCRGDFHRHHRVDICCPGASVRIGAMINSLLRFNPSKDAELAQLAPEVDSEGRLPDIDMTLYYSEEHGFYLVRSIAQVRLHGIWQTAIGADESLSVHRRHRRCLKTLRPLTRAQAIRLILESYLPEEEGTKDAVLETLSAAGII